MKKKCLAVFMCIFCVIFAFSEGRREAGGLQELGYFLFQPNASNAFANQAAATAQLNRLAQELIAANLAAGQVQVHGFAAVAANDINPGTLARDRATFVTNELVRRGVRRELFASPQGHGAVELWGTSIDANRRAVVTLDIQAAAQSPLAVPLAAPPPASVTAPAPVQTFQQTNQQTEQSAALRAAEEERFARLIAELAAMRAVELERQHQAATVAPQQVAPQHAPQHTAPPPPQQQFQQQRVTPPSADPAHGGQVVVNILNAGDTPATQVTEADPNQNTVINIFLQDGRTGAAGDTAAVLAPRQHDETAEQAALRSAEHYRALEASALRAAESDRAAEQAALRAAEYDRNDELAARRAQEEALQRAAENERAAQRAVARA